MAHDCLPTGHQLQHRNIPAAGHCIFCGRLERVEHLFLLCPFAGAVWSLVKDHYPIRLCRKDLVSAKQWSFYLLSRESDLNATVLAITCWHIWESRNDARNNIGNLQPECLAAKITVYVELVEHHCFKKCSLPRGVSNLQTPSWNPPPAGMLSLKS